MTVDENLRDINRLQSIFSASESGGFDQEYQCAMEKTVMFNRNNRNFIEVTGKDRNTLLHNILSANIANLPLNHGTEATFLTNKGKLIANINVFHCNFQTLIGLEAICEKPFIDKLSRYVIAEDAEFIPLTGHLSISIEGPLASATLCKILNCDIDKLNQLDHLETLTSDPFFLIAQHRDPSSRFDVIAKAKEMFELIDAAIENRVLVAGRQLAETRRIESGQPQFGIDIDDSNLPLEAGLDSAIDFNKGCYIGQEYVVRMAHRGHANQKLMGIRLKSSSIPIPGTIVMSDHSDVGRITSAQYSPGLQEVIALAFLKRGFFSPGTKIHIAEGTEDVTGVVVKTPFITPRS